MNIILDNLGKKFRNEWIFRNVHLSFKKGQSYTFIGPNGSGKSTLLQVLIGSLPQSEGKITYTNSQQTIEPDDIYKEISIAAPYLELVEELSLRESIEFHKKFKKIKNNWGSVELMDALQLSAHADKIIKNFSSGMKQRLKLGLAFYSETPIIVLDEPTSNLDVQGIDWYLEHVEKHTQDRLLIICSNQKNEYEFCQNIIDLRSFKQKTT